jgi:hypothetical protein
MTAVMPGTSLPVTPPAPAPVCCLSLNHTTAVRAYAAGVEDAVRAFASTLPEPCSRAVVTFHRPDGTIIERVDVLPEPEVTAGVTAGDALSNLVAAPQPI